MKWAQGVKNGVFFHIFLLSAARSLGELACTATRLWRFSIGILNGLQSGLQSPKNDTKTDWSHDEKGVGAKGKPNLPLLEKAIINSW